jgi:hypothetical protein
MSTPQNNYNLVPKCDRLADVDGKRDVDKFTEYLEGEWHITLQHLAHLAKLLGKKRRCKHCGNDL